jgi:glycogen phosphorylase
MADTESAATPSIRARSVASGEATGPHRVIELPDARTARDPVTLCRSFGDHLLFTQGKDEHLPAGLPRAATSLDRYLSVAYSVRDRLMSSWVDTQQAYYRSDAKRVYYLSLEFLLGKALENNLINMGLLESMRGALSGLGLDLSDLLAQEPDAGLGNGGLGRLAACFLDSMATLSLPSYGYGIRYEFGIFDQEIRDGWQVERPEQWLRLGNPWEIPRPEYTVPVGFYGRTEKGLGPDGRLRVRWVDARQVLGMPYDLPVVGYRNGTVNILRLWRARASEELDLTDFNAGDYLRAVEEKDLSESISKVLYPNDVTVMGKELRLQQQYFFVACSVHDIVNRHILVHGDLDGFADKVAIQLNDTHPAIAIAELMRVFVDEHGMPWGAAWELCQAVFGYTNHTLLPEALERWPVELFGRVLPRHLEIVYELNHRFLEWLRRERKADDGAIARMSLIEEGPVKQVRMANLAVLGSHSVNGVARLHTHLLETDLFRDFHELWPERFNSKTNGVSQRRWLLQANPELASLITECIGPRWIMEADELRRLEPLAEDAAFREGFRKIKTMNKQRLAEILRAENGVAFDPDTVLDVQVKRLHEYKRQLLNVLQIVAQYLRLKADPSRSSLPRTYLFGGKAAPGYWAAKWIMKLIHSVADVVNQDRDVRGRLSVVFAKNYRVSLAERIFPATDVSEQISTAGKEASGTGNMKFAMNGAVTIGTLDGANVEIREEVGHENFFLFGHTVEELAQLRAHGYDPWLYRRENGELQSVLDAIASGTFSPGQPTLFQPLVKGLLDGGDPYFVLADFASYLAAQERVSEVFRDVERWTRMAILNLARSGRFSSDRTIREYARDIWGVEPVASIR